MFGVLMPWDVGDEADRRFEFCRLVTGGGVSVSALCRRFGISRKTAYKWLARFEVEGRAGLVDRSRTPRRSPLRTDRSVEELVCSVRRAHPSWGGRKIRWVLERQGIDRLPAVSTITDILRRNGLIGPVVSRQLPVWQRFEAAAPNDLWQMDFKGWFDTTSGRCDPFDVLDDHSRFSLCLAACRDQTTRTVKGLLTDTFITYGLPKQILCDNGTPWANNQSGFRWTRLGVWLLDLGIRVSHSRVRHPQTMGKDERFHRTLGIEVLAERPIWKAQLTCKSRSISGDPFTTISDPTKRSTGRFQPTVTPHRLSPTQPSSPPTNIPTAIYHEKSLTMPASSFVDRTTRSAKHSSGEPSPSHPQPLRDSSTSTTANNTSAPTT